MEWIDKLSKHHWWSDKDLDRLQREYLSQADKALKKELAETQHEHNLEQLRHKHQLDLASKTELSKVERETTITLKLLDAKLDPQKRNLDYQDLIRQSDIALQTLDAELQLKDRIAQRDYKRKLDEVYQTMMMEITKETARLLDEQNKAIAINQQETQSKLLLERQHHQQAMEKASQEHQHHMERDTLLSQLKQEELTHEALTRLVIRIIAQQLGLAESDISKEQVTEWINDFEDKQAPF